MAVDPHRRFQDFRSGVIGWVVVAAIGGFTIMDLAMTLWYGADLPTSPLRQVAFAAAGFAVVLVVSAAVERLLATRLCRGR